MKLQLDQMIHSDQSPYSTRKIEFLMSSMLYTGFDETKPILVRLRSRRRVITYNRIKRHSSPRWEIFDGIHRYIALAYLQRSYAVAFSTIVPDGIPVREI